MIDNKNTIKKATLIILVAIQVLVGCHHSKDNISKLNFGFEQNKDGVPSPWFFQNSPDAGYVTYLDSKNAKSGNYSAAIECKEGNSYNFRT